MAKRIAVIGAGTAGALAAAFFSRPQRNKQPVEVQWYADPSIPAQAVGEGSNLTVPRNLLETINFTHQDLSQIDGAFKTGMAKYNWGKKNSYFFHDFGPPAVAYHFNAVKLQQYIAKRLDQEKRVTLINQNVTHDIVDADYIIDCSGRPKELNEDFHEFKAIPVNSVFVTQCFWDYPRFQYTLMVARKYGWVFGIPLGNRCSIGYLYNNKINNLDDIKEDVKAVFGQFNLTPSDTTNSFSFYSYCRKQNFTDRVAYNGNASFFTEPLEATTIGSMVVFNHKADGVINKTLSLQAANRYYQYTNQSIVDMIMLHYFAESAFDTPFWRHAKALADEQVSKAMNHAPFRIMCQDAIKNIKTDSKTYRIQPNKTAAVRDYGTWNIVSYTINILGLGIVDQLESLLNKYK